MSLSNLGMAETNWLISCEASCATSELTSGS